MYGHGTVVNFVPSFVRCVQSPSVSSTVRVRPKDLVVFCKDRVAVVHSLQGLLGFPCCE